MTLIIFQSIPLVIVLIGLFMIYTTFSDFYGNMGKIILLSYALFAVYNGIEIYILMQEDKLHALYVSRISSGVLATAYYMLHYFHDELSAVYRQRKTMTLASVIYGFVVGSAWFVDAIHIDEATGAPFVNKYYGIVIIIQAGFAVHRITTHIIIMSRLSDHYKIKTVISTNIRNWIRRVLLFSFVLGAFLMLFVKNIISLPFAIITAIGLLLLAILYKLDPISSVPIAQPMHAIALIKNGHTRFIHVFNSSSETIFGSEEFGSFINDLSRLYLDIMKSNTRARSLVTGEFMLMFEKINDSEYLLLVLKERAPFVRKILQNLAKRFNTTMVDNQITYSQIVEKHLLFPTRL